MNATRARSAFLCSRAALIRLFYGDRGLNKRFTWRGNVGGALDYKWWSLTSPTVADQYS
jgi:hypothetical protein